MKRICWSVAILLACVSAARCDSHPVKVHVHVILVDSELNQKPVPFLNVTLKGAATSSDVKTRLDGAAETTLSPGIYTVSTSKPVDFDGKRYSWSLRVTITGTEKTIDLTNENAKAEDNAAAAPPRSSGASGGDLTEQFKKLKNTVVTVISESGHGTGFFVDGKGLILTNQHVVAQSQYLVVQFDREHKIAARLIASDAQKDVALLWANMSALPGATPAVLARSSGGYVSVQEGERVFTIGSPLSLDKIITSGIVSKVDAHTIMSDININPGNSGGPLFNNTGHVIGLTTFGTSAETGPGVAGVVRIEEARALLEENRGKATGTPPSAALLPVEPLTPYPVEGLKQALQGDKFDARPYYLNAGDFEIALSTPLSITARKKKIACAPNAPKKSAIAGILTVRTQRSRTPTARTPRATGSPKPAASGPFLASMLCPRSGKGSAPLFPAACAMAMAQPTSSSGPISRA